MACPPTPEVLEIDDRRFGGDECVVIAVAAFPAVQPVAGQETAVETEKQRVRARSTVHPVASDTAIQRIAAAAALENVVGIVAI